MSVDNKKQDAESACEDLVRVLATSTNKNAFDVAVVDFSSEASISCPVVEVTKVKLPRMVIDSSTDIAAGLIEAETLLSHVGADQAVPVVLLFSDGGHNGSDDPMTVATRIKSRALIVTVAFGDDTDDLLLMQLASPKCFYRCTDGNSLRSFFSDFGTTMSTSLLSGVDQQVAMSQLNCQFR